MAVGVLSVLALSAFIFYEVSGHGMMLNPPGRASLWRYNTEAPINYDDNALFCGGASVQNEVNGGRCGVCGDAYSDSHPQDNENTGKYGQGIVGATYQAGGTAVTSIRLTANHLGTFNYSLCVLEDPTVPEQEDCFQPLLLLDGSEYSNVTADVLDFSDMVRLPNVTCERCVFRWTYRTGNSWGVCANGEGMLGCGPQEHFRNCADISIV